jgi:type I restriction enzyme S subunit
MLGEVTVNFDGRRIPVKASDRAKRPGRFPYFGASGAIDTIDDFIFDGEYLLIAEDGANLVTRTKPIAFRASGQFWVNNHAHVVQTTSSLDLRFLEMFLNGASLSGLITGTAQPKLTQANLNKLSVPVPPLDEQRRIVDRVEEKLSAVDALRSAIQRAQGRSASLRQGVLDRAFRGELVPQDASDEPALVLLERIRAEREAVSLRPRRRRVGA